MEELIKELKILGVLVDVCSGCGNQCNGSCPAGTHLEINHRKIVSSDSVQEELLEFMSWYCGDEYNKLPDDARNIIEIYCQQ